MFTEALFTIIKIWMNEWKLLSHVRLFATPWTVAARLLWPWNTPGQNTGVHSCSLSPGNLRNPEIEPRSPALQVDSYQLNHQGSPIKIWKTSNLINAILFSLKKGNSAIYDNIDEPRDLYVKWNSQSLKDKRCIIPFKVVKRESKMLVATA